MAGNECYFTVNFDPPSNCNDDDGLSDCEYDHGYKGNFDFILDDNDQCVNAYGPIPPSGIHLGYIADDAIIDSDALQSATTTTCGNARPLSTPGVWYQVIGNGYTITASTCDGTLFDSQISVFHGGPLFSPSTFIPNPSPLCTSCYTSTSVSCTNLTCVDGNDNSCGSLGLQSSISWLSNVDEIYFVLVHGGRGNFALQLSSNMPSIPGDVCADAQSISFIQHNEETDETADTAAAAAAAAVSIDLSNPTIDGTTCFMEIFPMFSVNPKACGVWRTVVGTGEWLTAYFVNYTDTVDWKLSRSTLSFGRPLLMSILKGQECSNLSCEMMCLLPDWVEEDREELTTPMPLETCPDDRGGIHGYNEFGYCRRDLTVTNCTYYFEEGQVYYLYFYVNYEQDFGRTFEVSFVNDNNETIYY